VGETVFEGTNIYTEIRYGLNLHYVTPTIVISEHAVLVRIGSELDFSSGPVEYTFTSSGWHSKDLDGLCRYAPNHNTGYNSFNIPEQIGESVIGDNSVKLKYLLAPIFGSHSCY